MRRALRAEWTKMRTVAGPRWLLLGAIAATVALSAGAASVATCTSAGCGGMTRTRLGLIGVELGQAPVAVLAVRAVAGEYGTGMIRTTLTAMPRRATALAAKAVTLTGLVAAAGTVAVLGSLLAGRLILPAHADAAPAAAAGSVLHLILVALLGLGVATVVRDSATGIGVVLGLLYVLPVLSRAIGDPYWQRLLQQIGPHSAAPGVTAGWAAAALAAGGVLLHVRDA